MQKHLHSYLPKTCICNYRLHPAKFKYDIQRNLASIGIEHATLFPDLDGLAITLRMRYESNIIGLVKHPNMGKFLLND
jgi:hypothetical protein